jgi:hypothetical protein
MTDAVRTRPVPEFPGYTISEYGTLSRGGVAMPMSRNRQGFAVYWPNRRGRTFRRRAIDLVAAAFLGVSETRRKAENLAIWPADGNEANVSPENIVVLRETDAVIQAHRDFTPYHRDCEDEPPLVDVQHIRNMRREFLRRGNLEIISGFVK